MKTVLRLLAVISTFTLLALSGCGGGNGTPTSGYGGTGTTTGSGGTGSTCYAISVPGTPSVYGVSPGNSSASMYISTPVPSSYGGNAIPISYYIVTSSPGNFTATGTSVYAPITVNGLTNGTKYTFTAQAVNCLGTGPTSMPSTSVTPSTVPDAPAGVTATPGNAQVSVAFTPPAYNGDARITSYEVTASPNGWTRSGTASPIVFLGLNNGTSYTFTVKAFNRNGASVASTPSAAVIPSVVPAGAPTNVIATSGDAQALVAFTPSTNTGGATIGSYTVTSNPGGITATGPASPIAIAGLTNNAAYTFTVTATYIEGWSATSLPSKSVIPIANPGPYYVDAGAGSDANPGTSALPFKTITYALAVARGAGTANTINAAAGTYNTASGETFPLRMVNNVDLVGAGSATTTIIGAEAYVDSSSTVSFITAIVIPPNITSAVSGFSITGGWQMSGYYTVMAVIDTATSGTLSANVIIETTYATDGVWVMNAGNATLSGNTITGTGWNRGYGALAVWDSSKLTARSNSFSGTHDPVISIMGNGTGTSPDVDLGTASSPGGNIINGPATSVGIDIRGVTNWVNASGNTWHANIQGSDAVGSFAVGTIGINPTPLTAGNNYAIGIDLVGTLSAGIQF